MKKVAVLCLPGAVEETLEQLRELGVVHVAHIQVPESDALDAARKRVDHVKRVLEVIPHRHRGVESTGITSEGVCEEVLKKLDQKRKLQETLDTNRAEYHRLEPFGDFDPEQVRSLAQHGIHVRLFSAPRTKTIEAVDGWEKIDLGHDKNAVYFAMIGVGEIKLTHASEFALPDASLGAYRERIEEAEKAIADVDAALATHAGDYDNVLALQHEAEEELRYVEVREGMGEAAAVSYLQGYCPVDAVEKIEVAAEQHGWGLTVEDPAEDDDVPTLIRNPAWVRMIKPVFDFIGVVPGYGEVDISTIFLLFFSVFFAMIVGDAGYGALFLGATIWGGIKFKQAPRQVFQLLTVMSICTIVWGVITGNYFGISTLAAPLAGLKVDWLSNESNIMFLCFTIGAVQLTLAHAWNAIRCINTPQALAQVGWICTTWMMFAAANALVLGYAFPKFVAIMGGVGVLLIVLFMTPARKVKKEFFNHIMLPLDLVSNFVDVVSYVRLFAVGMATFAVASAFNEMGLDIGFGSVISGFFAALIIFFGHALNVLLALMGVLVHGIRLNTLEFAGHIGMQWTGKKYNPFGRSGAQTEAQ